MATILPAHHLRSKNKKAGPTDFADFHVCGMSFRWSHLILLMLLGSVFLIDLRLPLGVASGVPYVICVSIASSLGLRWVWGTALLSSLLVLAGMELSSSGGEEWKVLSNRGLALMAIWATMLTTLRWLRTKEYLAYFNHRLEQQVTERTHNLEAAHQALARHALEQKQIANQLQESETLLALVIQGTSEGIWDWDINQNTLRFSPRFKELLGYKPEEFCDSLPNFHKHIHPQDIPRLNLAFQEHLATQAHFDIEVRICTKIGEYRHFRMRGQTVRNTDGQPVRMAGSLMDITNERLAMQRQNTQVAISHVLAEASDFEQAIPEILKAVCGTMGWVVGSFWESDTANIRLHCSAIVDIGSPPHPLFVQESQRTTFLSGVGLPGRVWANQCPSWIWDATHDSNFPRAPYAIQEHLQGALAFPVQLGQDRIGVMEFFSPDPISANTEFLLAIMVIGHQIGQFLQRKGMESQIVRSKQELERTNQELLVARDQALAAAQAKSNFLTTMSHEMRTPLNGVIGLTDILLADAVSRDHQEILKTISSCSTALLHLINDILDYSKMEAGKLSLECQDFNLRTIVEETLDILAPKAVSNHLELSGLIDTSTPVELRGDPHRLRQILINLIGNAIKFTDRGQVSLRIIRESPEATSPFIRFEVTDTGIGIAQDIQPRLFQSFHQADSTMARKFGGTGLGLAISKQLVELMDGTIGFTSHQGMGSCFWFTIPLERRQPLMPVMDQQPWHSLRACLIEDSENTQEVLTHYLQSWGINCTTALSGTDGLAFMEQTDRNEQPIDLLIVDASLPDMDPWTFAQRIISNPLLSSSKLILLTDLSTRDLAQQSSQAGYRTHIMKPLHYRKLYDGIRNALEIDAFPEGPKIVPASSKLPTATLPVNHPHYSRILLVEDNEINQRVAARLLTKLHLQVDLANNGREALAALQQRTYEVIFMDCQMPDMDGFETTRV
ncbi:MAG: ATP-binding protein, partial [Nitrospirales bacterium]